MATVFPKRRFSAPVKSSVRIPAWAIARRLSGRQTPLGSPDSAAKQTVQTLPSEEDESLALPRMEGNRNSVAACNSILLQMDVTGFLVEDLHVDVDVAAKKVCLAGKGPRMFKRSFPIPAYEETDMPRLSASFVEEDDGRRYLVLKTADGSSADSVSVNSQGRRSICIKDETRPPLLIEVPGP